jgi:hypothetical protein
MASGKAFVVMLLIAALGWAMDSKAGNDDFERVLAAAKSCAEFALIGPESELPESFVQYARFRLCMSKAGFVLNSKICDPNKEFNKPMCWMRAEK